MAKWQLADYRDAAEDLAGMSDDVKEKLGIIRALVPGKMTVVEAEAAKQRGYKEALPPCKGWASSSTATRTRSA